jgi:hypothetical protein
MASPINDPPMQQALNRFERRLSLPEKWKFVVVHCEENNNPKLKKKFREHKHTSVLELYHATRDIDPSVVMHSIMTSGFRPGTKGNKGYGIYLANHSRYSFNWGNGYHVLICHVINDPKLVERYRSEIYSPTWDSEYVVKDNTIIYPLYYLHYDVIIPNRHTGQWYNEIKMGYVEHGTFGCAKCDIKDQHGDYRRCDCKFDTIDQRDIVLL